MKKKKHWGDFYGSQLAFVDYGSFYSPELVEVVDVPDWNAIGEEILVKFVERVGECWVDACELTLIGPVAKELIRVCP